MATKPATAPKSYHFFGSTGLNWATAETREEVLATLARMAGAATIKANVAGHGGLYAWTCRVELPKAANYEIQNYTPAHVPCSNVRNYVILGVQKWAEEVPDTIPAEDCTEYDPYGQRAHAAKVAAAE